LRDDDESLRFLLSGGRLSDDMHDVIRAKVVAGRPAGSRGWRWFIGATLVAGAAAAVLALVPVVRRTSAPEDWLAAKGGGSGSSLTARCLTQSEGRCLRGDRLVFEADTNDEARLLAAYVDGPTGERIWYFPAADGHLASFPARRGPALAGEIARIGSDWPAGRYDLHLFLLSRPADRGSVLAGNAAVRAKAVVSFSVAAP
jgi:hypothetical protein